MGDAAFRKIQIGQESVAGTKVAATAKLIGSLTMQEEMVVHRPEEERGSRAPNHRTVVTGEGVKLSFDGDATFEQIMYLLNMAMHADTAPVGSDPYTWTHEPNLTTADTLKTLTIEYGDLTQEHEVEYVLCSSLEISGSMDEPWTVKADLFGRNLAASTFTGALSDPATLESILTNKTRLYIDNSGTSHGTTEKATTLIDFSLKIETGLTPRKHGGQTLYFDAVSQGPVKVSLDMTFEYNAGAEAERLLYVSGTRRLVRLISSGSGSKTATIDMAGVYTSYSGLEEKDSGDTVSVSLEGEYDPTWAKLIQIVIVNSTATLA